MKYNKLVITGHLVTSFENVVNGLLALVMAPYFFGASQSSFVQLLASFASYIAPYIAAPTGVVAFGNLGDKFGRSKTLLINMIGIGILACLIGILPDYSKIGAVAPIILILLRLIEGVLSEAEFVGIFIYNYETGNKKTSSSANVLAFGCYSGCIAAIFCFVITQEGMPDWGWRIPFTFGGIFAFIASLFRMRIRETDDFIKVLENSRILKSPLKTIIKNYKLETMTGVAITAISMVTMHSSMVFGNRLFQQAGYSISQSMLFNVLDLLWLGISHMICGNIANRIGVLRQLSCGSLILITLIFPVCLLITGELSFTKIYSFMAIMTLLSSMISSSSLMYILRSFPTSCRYSGFLMVDAFGSIIGASTAFMMLLLSGIFDSNLGCAIWLYIVTIPTFVLICITNRKIKKKGFAEEC